MRPWVIDANVWVAAADPTDPCSPASRRCLQAVMRSRDRLVLPAIAPLEVACALSRRFRNAATGRALAHRLARSERLTLLDVDSLHDHALELGTEGFLRAADTLYAAAAHEIGGQLISWDQELVQRAGAVTPEEWLASHAQS